MSNFRSNDLRFLQNPRRARNVSQNYTDHLDHFVPMNAFARTALSRGQLRPEFMRYKKVSVSGAVLGDDFMYHSVLAAWREGKLAVVFVTNFTIGN